MILLCGDIGASNSRLAIVEINGQKLHFHASDFLKNSQFQNFNESLALFQKKHSQKIEGASFGVAGPVLQGKVQITNLNWQFDEKSIAEFLNIKRCFLINDLEAIAYGVSSLEPEDYREIIPGKIAEGTRAVIAPGSGIGEAILFWDGLQHRPMPTEGGHSSYSPTSPLQLELLQFLSQKWSHVSWERVLSGPGILNIYEFLQQKSPPNTRYKTSAEITDAALKGDGVGIKTLELFFEILATEAGNLALKTLPVGGLYIAGGIMPKLLKLLDQEKFIKAFLHKGRMSELLKNFKVTVILNENVGILGAARYAQLKRPRL